VCCLFVTMIWYSAWRCTEDTNTRMLNNLNCKFFLVQKYSISFKCYLSCIFYLVNEAIVLCSFVPSNDYLFRFLFWFSLTHSLLYKQLDFGKYLRSSRYILQYLLNFHLIIIYIDTDKIKIRWKLAHKNKNTNKY
jgi:hypothetical protein